MKTKLLYADLIERKAKLSDVKTMLKKKFIGLDDVIDEVISMMTPWYIFPEAQLRPTIINLWGLTGSGKTALVEAIVEILNWDKLYTRLDIGEFESEDGAWMKNILTDDLAFFDKKSVMICLDEFQFARTLDSDQQERGNDKLRVIWDLLDSGKIQYVSSGNTYYLFRADNCRKRLERLVNTNVIIKDGVIVQGEDLFLKEFEGFYFEFNGRNGSTLDGSYFTSSDFVNGLLNVLDNDDSSRENLLSGIKSSSLTELISLVNTQ